MYYLSFRIWYKIIYDRHKCWSEAYTDINHKSTEVKIENIEDFEKQLLQQYDRKPVTFSFSQKRSKKSRRKKNKFVLHHKWSLECAMPNFDKIYIASYLFKRIKLTTNEFFAVFRLGSFVGNRHKSNKKLTQKSGSQNEGLWASIGKVLPEFRMTMEKVWRNVVIKHHFE